MRLSCAIFIGDKTQKLRARSDSAINWKLAWLSYHQTNLASALDERAGCDFGQMDTDIPRTVLTMFAIFLLSSRRQDRHRAGQTAMNR
ncbi:hypothetical protein BaRGS_00033936 [Batillaria attramentaria]|uniref:Uncharacterized protein n=1 Tax=Batillaria attramentaria TaxID=370345 RepID=A0ABD0JIT3_9CAEN